MPLCPIIRRIPRRRLLLHQLLSDPPSPDTSHMTRFRPLRPIQPLIRPCMRARTRAARHPVPKFDLSQCYHMVEVRGLRTRSSTPSSPFYTDFKCFRGLFLDATALLHADQPPASSSSGFDSMSTPHSPDLSSYSSGIGLLLLLAPLRPIG
jgi:hypothetical protein